ncbi:MAG: DUF4197 domain-containing protein [Sulfurimonas sp.]|uniref:DUF4197 domain-containing protein n=1 Tax=Sulfurimonas sp. TaxID=2022749 RepID=UPI00262077E3|nr:DUF4197 domain-containing protein [Sulfurimonas sp.]MCW8895400.1 DUF4197 domain-containing protein [Sulfurimonas sp.]MCW8953413.1 DUF4197 domain-containing protein [Sulfurimonas sp.]
MKKTSIFTVILFASTTAFSFDFGSVLKSVESATTSNSTTTSKTDLSDSTVTNGLKEALKIGVDYGVKELGKKDGYLNNQMAKIALPGDLAKAEGLIRKAGGEEMADNLILSMNSAATQAAPKTATIFMSAIEKMTLTDAKKILAGNKDAATEYFKENTTKSLQEMIKPIVKEAMQDNQVAVYYDKVNEFYNSNVKELVNSNGIMDMAKGFGADEYLPSGSDENLDEYVTQKAIDGLFKMIATKESQIRQEPIAQTTSLLKQVFGN